MLVFLANFFVLTSQHAAICLIRGSSGPKQLCNDVVLLISGPYVDQVDLQPVFFYFSTYMDKVRSKKISALRAVKTHPKKIPPFGRIKLL